MERVASALITVIVGVGGAILYFYLSNLVLDSIFPARGKGPKRPAIRKSPPPSGPGSFSDRR